MARRARGRENAVGSAAITALQSVLAAENAAVYGYGLAGAQLSGGQFSAAQQDWTVHRMACAALSAMITERGAAPGAAAVAYRPPFPVTGAAVTESDGEVGKFAGGENQLPVTLAARAGPIAPGSGTTGWVTKFNTERFATVLVTEP